MAEPSLDDTGQQAFERNEANNQWLSKIGQTWPARAAMSALEAFKLPGQVYSGEVQLRDEGGKLSAPAVDKIAELASMISGGSFAMPAVKGGAGMGIRAYHGSPHDFDRFDLSKIGTGEGAQAYGHGLYFAENPNVAADYRRRLADMSAPSGAFKVSSGDELGVLDWPKGLSSLLERAQSRGPDVPYPELLSRAQAEVDRLSDPLFRGPLIARNRAEAQSLVEWLKSNEGIGWVSNPERGRMYEVDINAHPDQFLDWDKPLTWHTQDKNYDNISTALAKKERSDPVNSGVWHQLQQDMPLKYGQDLWRMLRSKEVGAMQPNDAMNFLRDEAGIPGIKYLDQGSRAAGDGSRNYVVFDDKIVNILRKYGIAAGATTPPAFSALAEFMAQGQPQGEQ